MSEDKKDPDSPQVESVEIETVDINDLPEDYQENETHHETVTPEENQNTDDFEQSAPNISDDEALDIPQEAGELSDDTASVELFDEYAAQEPTDDSFHDDEYADPAVSGKKNYSHIIVGVGVIAVVALAFFFFKDTLLGTTGGNVQPQALQKQESAISQPTMQNTGVSQPTSAEKAQTSQEELKGLLMAPEKANTIDTGATKAAQGVYDYGQPPIPTPVTNAKYVAVDADKLAQDMEAEYQERIAAEQVAVEEAVRREAEQEADVLAADRAEQEAKERIEKERLAAEQEARRQAEQEAALAQKKAEEQKAAEQAKQQAPQEEKAESTTVAKQDKPVLVKPSPQWELRSAKDGVAWLSQKGDRSEMIRVTVGQSVRGLGTIRKINQVDGAWQVQGSLKTISQK